MQTSTALVSSLGLVVCLMFFALWKFSSDGSAYRSRDDSQLMSLVQTLRFAKEKVEMERKKNEREMKYLILSRFQWMHKSNTVANIHLLKQSHHAVMSLRNGSQSTSLVFVHQPRTSGSHVISCMNKISNEQKISKSPMMTIPNRLQWDQTNSYNEKWKSKYQFHRGPFAFGMCEHLNTKCSYFSMFRDPFDAIVSLHKRCKSHKYDDACAMMDVDDVTLREWIYGHAGYLLYYFIFSSDLCTDPQVTRFNGTMTSQKGEESSRCWFKQMLYFRETLLESEKYLLAHYIARNLRQWFTAVGLFDEIDLSMDIFEKTFQQPFSKCKSSRNMNYNEADLLSNNAHSATSDVTKEESLEIEEDDISDDFDDEDLRNDPDIVEELKYDYIIFKEARRLYFMQKQVLYNKIGIS